MRPAALEQQLGGRRRARPEAARGELHQHAALDERADAIGSGLERVAALGMRERHPEAAGDHGQHALLEVGGQVAIRRLEQQVGAVAAKRRELELRVGQRGGRVEVDLGTGEHLHRQPPFAQVGGQLARPFGQLARPHAGVVGTQMRGRDERADAAVRRDLGHGDAPGEVVGPVVDAGQHVRVQVDHGADIGEVSP